MTSPDDAETPDLGSAVGVPEEPEAPPAELLTLRDGLPPVADTAPELAEACAALAAGTGPVAIDAERASGYRYSARAYLVQLRREGSGSFLVDPVAFDSLDPLQEALRGTEWILHAATQDLPCLREVGLRPDSLFDTELAGRLLGHPRVGLATLVETQLGKRLRKEHSAQDWSTRPLPEPWLEYAALDVEALVELREVMVAQLEEAGKTEWARQEFEALLDHEAPVRVDAWRRTSGMHKVRGRRGLAAVRALWTARDDIASSRDVTPGRIIPDSAIVAAAQAMPTERRALLSTPGFHGRGASRYSSRWVEALQEAAEMPEEDLPPRSPRSDGPPVPRAWAERDPVAAERLTLARAELAEVAEAHVVPTENLMTPDTVRRVLWEPPATRDPEALATEVDAALLRLGARPWQVEIVAPVLVRAILGAEAG
ncbi:ribonuclease D [uncultured Nocardioides sp.]|uniref:ribonuclease D n=1 Tax=uncultured Nocardioides sp. TaxID=198441 RepID=UPI00261E2DC3|nr:ribonuclease D [uncultured Nocardioides sp.]